MNQLLNIKDAIVNSLFAFQEQFLQVLPNVLAAIFLILVGWLAARLLSYLFGKLLKVVKFDSFANRIHANDMLRRANIWQSPSQILTRFLYWLILLLFFVTATDVLGLTVVSEQISKLIGFLPTLLSGMVLFIVGYYMATFFREVLSATTASLGLSGGKMISNFVFYFLMVIISITALDQIGIDTTIITSNVVLILGSILLAASISYGFASRHILTNMLAGFYSRKTFRAGQYIRIDNIEGEIIAIDSIAVTLQTPTEKVVMPTQELITKRVFILRED